MITGTRTQTFDRSISIYGAALYDLAVGSNWVQNPRPPGCTRVMSSPQSLALCRDFPGLTRSHPDFSTPPGMVSKGSPVRVRQRALQEVPAPSRIFSRALLVATR